MSYFNDSGIDWPWKPLYTFNPVTGCKRGCPWCYARGIWTRFHKPRTGLDFADVHFWPERLEQPPPKKVKHVFVGSMSDIEYWKPEWTREIVDYCGRHDEREFYFLSKNPMSYAGFSWPLNCHLGLTMTLTQTAHCQHETIDAMLNLSNLFLSLEPLLGELSAYPTIGIFKKIIVGAMTGPGAIKPRPEWIDSIKRLNLDNVYWKNNIGGNGAGKGV